MDPNNFQIIEAFSINSSGQVFLVKNSNTQTQYVAKTLFKKFSNEEEQISFSLEIQKLQQLQNPGIIRVNFFSFTNFFKENLPTIFTEYIPGKPLQQLILKDSTSQTNPVKLTNTSKYIILLGIAISLNYIHSQELVYYDLKPDNILIDDNFYPHLSLLGLTSTFSSDFHNCRINSMIYMAPEIFEKKQYNSKADVYSYVMIAYLILTGKEPAVDEISYKQIENIIKGKRPDQSCIQNNELKKFISKCWSKDPSERPSFNEIIDTLMDEKFYLIFEANFSVIMNYLHSQEGNEIINQTFYRNVKKPKNGKFEFNVVLVGEVNSGKTALFQTYLNGIKVLETYPTVESSFNQVQIQTDFGEVKLTLCDTTGYDKFKVLLPTYVRTASAVVFFTDMSSHEEYKNLNQYIEIVNKHSELSLKYLAVTKCDLEWKNTKEDLSSFANKNNMILCMTSCDNMESIEKMFKRIATDLIMKSIDL
ncbi:hypothetical protein M9Y10_037747 [Tritrichomonas musculus]|uniref:Protein kinase domain-containing protein n=1 Tax=Tritrichomonas musculus TaxID=1915356 RepID=A0ABR2GRC0_9EUKA